MTRYVRDRLRLRVLRVRDLKLLVLIRQFNNTLGLAAATDNPVLADLCAC